LRINGGGTHGKGGNEVKQVQFLSIQTPQCK
jgi:hypothetical protein